MEENLAQLNFAQIPERLKSTRFVSRFFQHIDGGCCEFEVPKEQLSNESSVAKMILFLQLSDVFWNMPSWGIYISNMITPQIATVWTGHVGKSAAPAMDELRRVNSEHG